MRLHSVTTAAVGNWGNVGRFLNCKTFTKDIKYRCKAHGIIITNDVYITVAVSRLLNYQGWYYTFITFFLVT